MQYYDIINVSEGFNKTSQSKEFHIFHYWYFWIKGSSRCHDLLMMSVKLNNNDILNIKGADYCCIISRISKSEAINLMQNIDLTEKGKKNKKHKHLLKLNIRINFLNCKFASSFNLDEKSGKLSIKTILKVYTNADKKIIKFHQH